MTDLHAKPEFEEELARAMRSYAAEGVGTFDPRRVSAQARSAGIARRSWWLNRPLPLVQLPVLRFALLILLLALAGAALAVVGARLVTPAPRIPGLLAVGDMDQVAVIDPASGARHALTAATTHDDFPVWSPDGARIAFSQHDGRGQLQLMDADGGNRHPIVDGMTSPEPVAWSPDGGRIAFVGYHYPGGADRGLYVVGADGRGLTLLVPDAGPDTSLGMSRLAWSPDGSLIAFAAMDSNGPVDGLRGYVYVVDVESRLVSRVSGSDVATGTGDVPIAWRPGQLQLLYAQRDPQPGEASPSPLPAPRRQAIVLAEWVGGVWRERQLVTGLSGSAVPFPMWLDADRFAYVRENRLWVAGVDGRPETPIGEPALNPAGPGCVAPDGSAVVVPVPAADDPNKADLLSVPTRGDSATRIDELGWLSLNCSWQGLRP